MEEIKRISQQCKRSRLFRDFLAIYKRARIQILEHQLKIYKVHKVSRQKFLKDSKILNNLLMPVSLWLAVNMLDLHQFYKLKTWKQLKEFYNNTIEINLQLFRKLVIKILVNINPSNLMTYPISRFLKNNTLQSYRIRIIQEKTFSLLRNLGFELNYILIIFVNYIH